MSYKKDTVLYPTHGIRINSKIIQFLKDEKITLLALESNDFYNIVEACKAYNKQKILGIAIIGQRLVILNATRLKKLHSQALINYVCLHEIEHIRKQSLDERYVDRCAKKLAFELGLLKREDMYHEQEDL